MVRGVIVVGDVLDEGLSRIEDNLPLCLFPVANREILSYQLEWFFSSGLRDVYVTTIEKYKGKLEKFLTSDKIVDMNVHLCVMEGQIGTASALRHVSSTFGLSGDFVVLDADTLVSYPLSQISSKHRLSGAAITAIFSHPEVEDDEKKKKKAKGMELPAVCINEKGRIVLKPTQQLREGGTVEITKHSINTGISFRLYSDLLDCGVYCCGGEVVQVLADNLDIVSLGHDMLEHVMKAKGESTALGVDAAPIYYDTIILGGRGVVPELQMSSSTTDIFNSRIFGATQLLAMNRDMPAFMLAEKEKQGRALWTMAPGWIKKSLSIVGTDVDVKEKVVMKLSSIRDGCRVATKSKLNNSLLMDGVTIGENCTVQNSILASGAVLEDNCNVNDCLIGRNTTVPAGTKTKNEVIVSQPAIL